MKRTHFILMAGLFIFLAGSSRICAQSTAFTYQGRLDDGGNAASGLYDLQFKIFDALANGSAVGGPLTNTMTSVSNGLFTVALDFGAGLFSGGNRWLEIGVRTNGSTADFVALQPRQPIAPTPYALAAFKLIGVLPDSQLSSNIARLNASQTFTGTVLFNNVSNTFTGNFAGNGAGVTNVNLTSSSPTGAVALLSNPNTLAFRGTVSMGPFPFSVVAADFNGDGRLDLASGLVSNNVVSVVLGRGDGTFISAQLFPAGGNPAGLAAGDFDRDGIPDLVTANYNSNTVSVLRGVGDGTFLSPVAFPTGSNAFAVAVGDFNLDGNLDFVAANFSNATVSVFLNDGTGQFPSPQQFAVGTLPRAVVVGDVNGDFRPDIVTANQGANTASVLLGNGDGTFQTQRVFSLGNTPVSIALNDINGDHRLDLVSANLAGNSLSVLFGLGDGNFVPQPTIPLSTPNAVVAADFNGDGRTDLVAAGGGGFLGGGVLTLLTNSFGGGWVTAATIPLPAMGGPAFGLAAADLNADGRPDVVAAQFINSGPLSIVMNQPGATRVQFNGAFNGNGALLTNVNAALLGGLDSSAFWKLSGNSNTVAGMHFLGTADNQPLEFKVWGQRVLRLENGANVIGGSQNNQVVQGISGSSGATIAGGAGNTVGSYFPTVGGGLGNTASNYYATVPGGANNVAYGAYSFAAGYGARALHDGAFVWAHLSNDSNGVPIPFPSSSSNEFAVRATGGVRFVTGLDTNGTPSAGVTVAPGSGSWGSLSDRNAKENFAPADAHEILQKVTALPLATWNYKAQDKAIRHLGPTAQDFRATFCLGENDRTISTVDAAGVALAAIQGLNQRVEEQRAELQQKQAEIAELKQRLEKLERCVGSGGLEWH